MLSNIIFIKHLKLVGITKEYTMENHITPGLHREFFKKKEIINNPKNPLIFFSFSFSVNDIPVAEWNTTSLLREFVGLEVETIEQIPIGMFGLDIINQKYISIKHQGNEKSLRGFMGMIKDELLPRSGHKIAQAYPFEKFDLEKYDVFDDRESNERDIFIPIE